MKGMIKRFKSSTKTPSSHPPNISTAPKGALFLATDPTLDGEDCLHDCETCTIHYPPKWDVDVDEKLYGGVNGWSTHLIVATGKSDWVRDVSDEGGSVMEAVGKGGCVPGNGKLMLSASNIPVPTSKAAEDATTVLLLPSFTFIDNVTPSSVPELITQYIDTAPTTTTPLSSTSTAQIPANTLPTLSTLSTANAPTTITTSPTVLHTRPCPHRYLILLCSQKTRDARCGQSAPLLRREFERHLRPLGLYRDLHDERPGGCGIYFISHVGGHKFAANVMIYRRADALGTAWEPMAGETGKEENGNGNGEGKVEGEKKSGGDVDRGLEAAQCIWLARVNPEDCENIVKYTILQGKVVKPEKQLRGGFDRGRGLVSW